MYFKSKPKMCGLDTHTHTLVMLSHTMFNLSTTGRTISRILIATIATCICSFWSFSLPRYVVSTVGLLTPCHNSTDALRRLPFVLQSHGLMMFYVGTGCWEERGLISLNHVEHVRIWTCIYRHEYLVICMYTKRLHASYVYPWKICHKFTRTPYTKLKCLEFVSTRSSQQASNYLNPINNKTTLWGSKST